MRTQRVFCPGYKLQAVMLVTDQWPAFAQSAQDVELREKILRKFVNQQRSDPQ